MKNLMSISMLSLSFLSLNCAVQDNNNSLVVVFSKGSAATAKEAFEKLIASDKPVVVKFGAEWCGPCKAIAVPFQKMAKDFKDKATFVTVDRDNHLAIATSYGIQGIPAFAIFAKGKLINPVFSGSNKVKDIPAILNTYLSKKS